MALKFGCKNCGEDVVVQFLKFPRLLNAKMWHQQSSSRNGRKH